MPGLCSTEWKKRVIHRFLRSRGFGPANPVRVWLGISVDEVQRAKDSGVAWAANHYPLLFDVPMRRGECLSLVASAGLPTPPKSSCWMCPYRSNAQWASLRDEQPGDWAKAVALDEEIRSRDPDVFVHRSGRPLGEADLSDGDASQMDLLQTCDTGYCYV